MPDATTQIPSPPAELVQHLNRGDCVLFVGDALDGAGSQSSRLASALVDACGAHCTFCQEGGRCLHPSDCAVPLTRAAQLYESRTNRQSLIDFVLRRVGDAGPPTPIHRALAALPVRVVITTAYDDRMEEALRSSGRPYLSIVRDADVPFDDPGRVQLIRLHGSISQPDSLVLTEDDAADLFARLSPVTKNVIQAHLATKTLLFVGYKLSGSYFRLLYRQATGPIDRFKRPAYAVQWPPDETEAASWRRQITFIEAELLPFLTQLTQSTHIQTVALRPVTLPPRPYKFLDYYTHEDVAIFFGRDLEADLLLSMVLAHNLTVFYGRSGTGKTSLLLARVGPALEEAGYRMAYTRMLGDPTAEVKAAVRGVPVGQLAHTDHGCRLCDILAEALPPTGRLVIVLDQFEEFFVRQGEDVWRDFARELADCFRPALGEETLDVRFVFSLRDDYLGALDELSEALPQDVFAHRYRLENLTREKALLAILKPAEAFGLPIEEPLREHLIADLEDQGLEPTNLQIVLHELYRDAVERGLWSEDGKRGAGLTLARYQALGRTREILAGYLDGVLGRLPVAGQQGARAVLKSMVTAERTKAAVSGQEIVRGDLVTKVGLAEGQLDDLLAYLREQRVVRKFGDEDRYELAHEVMVEKVWAWVSDEELRVLEVRDMLRREASNYEKFRHLLTREKLALLTACGESLALEAGELELLFRSALAAGYEVGYWFERAREEGVKVDDIAMEGLKSDNFRTRAAAVATLGQLGERFAGPIICMLADGYPQVRMVAIHILERLQPTGEWRAHLRYECYVPARLFTMGDDQDDRDDEKPAHEIYLEAFYIGKYPVTNAEYKRFMEDMRQPWDTPAGKANHPAVNVTWYQARNYAAWAGMRLLTEAEWEKAASWEEPESKRVMERLHRLIVRLEEEEGKALSDRKWKYPWGDKFDKSKCNTKESGIGATTPVGAYSPGGDSSCGCADMAGNVWEWTSSLGQSYPYRTDDGREDPDAHGLRVLRGGSFSSEASRARCVYRVFAYPDDDWGYRGFRCGVSP